MKLPHRLVRVTAVDVARSTRLTPVASVAAEIDPLAAPDLRLGERVSTGKFKSKAELTMAGIDGADLGSAPMMAL